MNLEECRVKCLNNCSCTAYSNSDLNDGGSGYTIWYGDLIDIRQIPFGGQGLYIRMLASGIGMFPISIMLCILIHFASLGCGLTIFSLLCQIQPCKGKKGHKMKKVVVVVAAALAVIFGMLLIGFCICRRRTKLKGKVVVK